jgi:hypothetical protein
MANDGHQIAVAPRLRPENTKAVLAVVEGDPLHKAGEYFLTRWFKIGLHTLWKPRVNNSGRDALDVLPGDFWSHPAGVFPLSLFVLQSDGLEEPQPKNLLGLIDAAQLKMSERLQASVTASCSLCEPR